MKLLTKISDATTRNIPITQQRAMLMKVSYGSFLYTVAHISQNPFL